MKKQISILMSTMMVQAILAGRKTMTRRTSGLDEINESPDKWQFSHFEANSKGGWNAVFKPKEEFVYELGHQYSVRCPYGKPGDILWVRETLYQKGELGLEYVADKDYIDEDIIPLDHKPYRNYAFCNIPSIHMPKWAARIWLEVTDIRVERLHDITEQDAIAEGVLLHERGEKWLNYEDNEWKTTQFVYNCRTAKDSFRTLWCIINGRDSYWSNPWVWVVSFKVFSTTGKPATI